MSPTRILGNSTGFAMLLLTFVAAMVIALMIFMSNRAYQQSGQARSYVKEQLAALDLMKEVAVMLRRSYDIRRSFLDSGVCPADTVLYEVTRAGAPGGKVELCLPAGDRSCFAHPLNPLARICLDVDAPALGGTTPPEIALGPDRRGGQEMWAQSYEQWGWDHQEVAAFLQSLERNLSPLPRAYAQMNSQTTPWFPRINELGATSYTVQTGPTNYSCVANTDMLCVSFSVCLRYQGCDDVDKTQGRFSQTVGLDREQF